MFRRPIQTVFPLEASSFDLGGVKTRYSPTEHEGSHFVDLAIVSREGKFIH